MALDEAPLETTPEGDVVVTLDDPAEAALPSFGDDDSLNLVVDLIATEEGRKALKRISDDVDRKFKNDWDGSENYRKRIAEDHRILYCDLPPKTSPWADCANAAVPSTLENMSRICARMESEICGDYSNVFGVMPVGAADEDMAQMLTLHGNWQIREKLDDFSRQQSRGILMFMMDGDVTNHAYWDPLRRLPVLEMLTPDEFVTPYAYTTTRVDYSDLPHYTKIFRKYRHELEGMRDVWHDVDAVLENRKPSFDDEPEQELREARAKVEGVEAPDDATDAPYKLLHHEGWMTLPGRDKQRWCQVILDPVSKAILCLTIHEEVNWQDKLRFERQSAELQTFQQAQAMHAQAAAQHEQVAGAAQAAQQMHDEALPHMAPEQAQLAAQHLQAVHAQVPPPPVPPVPPPWMKTGMEEPAPPRRDPIYMFAHGVCMESLVGNLGLGFGRVQADLNRAQNVMLSQFIDAGTLANGGAFLTTDAFEEDSPIEFRPGAFIRVQGIPQGQLGANIQPLAFPPANPQLLEGVKLFGEMGQSSLQAPAVLSGESGKSGETYRGISSRIEQATKQLSVPARAYCRFLKQILRNLARLNAVYLDEEEVATVMNQNGAYQEVRATKEMYARNYQVTISADLRFASQTQRIAEADEIVAMPGSIPPLQNNPAFQWYAIRKALIARGREDLIPYLGAPPPKTIMFGLPPPPPPPEVMMQVFPNGPPPPPGGPPGPGGPPHPGSGPKPPQEQSAGETPPPGNGPPPNPNRPPGPPKAPASPSPSQSAGPPG